MNKRVHAGRGTAENVIAAMRQLMAEGIPLSANEITERVGGSRNDVLKLIWETVGHTLASSHPAVDAAITPQLYTLTTAAPGLFAALEGLAGEILAAQASLSAKWERQQAEHDRVLTLGHQQRLEEIRAELAAEAAAGNEARDRASRRGHELLEKRCAEAQSECAALHRTVLDYEGVIEDQRADLHRLRLQAEALQAEVRRLSTYNAELADQFPMPTRRGNRPRPRYAKLRC